MAYPQTKLPVVVEIAPGAAPAADPGTWRWVDVTELARVNDGITIDAGRADWGQDTDPGTVSLIFNNPDGRFSPDNPYGQWYGLLGKDTPLRVRLRRGEDRFARTVSAGWGTALSGQAWQMVGAGGTVSSATDASVAGGAGLLRVPQEVAHRSMLLGSYLRDVEVAATVRVAITDVTGGAIEPAGVLLRVQDDLNTQYMARVEVSAAEAVTLVLYGPSGALASAPVPGVVWAGQPLRIRAGISGQQLYARAWDPTGAEPAAGWQVTAVDQSATAIRGRGRVGLRTGVAAGNTNAKPVEARWTDVEVLVDLGAGTVPAWTPSSDLSGKIRTVAVAARGTLYRHKPGQSSPPELSPWRRTITSRALSGLLAYWPCEDGEAATQAASGLPGGTPMYATPAVRFADRDDGFFVAGSFDFPAGLLPGTLGGARVANVDRGTLTGPVPAGTSSPIRWSVCWVARPVTSGATYPLMRWDTPGGGIDQWEYRHASVVNQSGLWGRQASDGTWLQFASLFDDTPRLREYRVEAVQDSPGGIILRLWVDGVKVSDAAWLATIGRVSQVAVNPWGADVDALTVGHVQVWDTDTPPRLGVEGTTATWQPVDGYGVKIFPYWRWAYEAAHLRLARLAAEDGIAIDMAPVDADAVQRMGQQPDGAGIDLYRDCVRTDGGILYERPFALGYRTRQSLYNQAPALVLDAAQLAAVPVPDSSGQRYRNRWTVTRSGGSEVTADAPDLAAGALPYPASDDVSLATDAQLPHQAGWRLHLTSAAARPWPRLELSMWATPELLDAWLSTQLGDRIVVTNPPADAAGQGIDVLLEGFQLTLGHKEFRVVANCSPASPWTVATVGGESRIAADGTTLAAGISAGALSMQITSTAFNRPWTTDPADFPLAIRVGAERVTATSITGAGLTQTVTLSARAVNRVSRAWPAGTEVDVWLPAITAL